MTSSLGGVGVYEKALTPADWPRRFEQASAAGYDFVEMAVDDDPERASRLRWDAPTVRAVQEAAAEADSHVGTVVLSLHRAFPLGSRDPEIRARARRIGVAGIRLATSLGAPMVQLAGYATYSEPSHPDAVKWFLDGLGSLTRYAEDESVMLALENMDGHDVTTAEEAVGMVSRIGSPALRLYVDVGNFTGQGLDAAEQLRTALPYAVAVQLKDARRGEYRRVPYGDGEVPWQRVFELLRQERYEGPLSLEMWNDDGDVLMPSDARRWLRESLGR